MPEQRPGNSASQRETWKKPGQEATGAKHWVQVSRRLLATDLVPAAPMLEGGNIQADSQQADTFRWQWEQRVNSFIMRHEPEVQRTLEILPGALTWALILIPLFLARWAPVVPVLLAVLYQFYWLYRGGAMLIYGTVGYARLRAHACLDWQASYEAERAAGRQVLPWEEIRHLVIIPNCGEPIAKLRATLEALARQRAVASHIWVVLAMEAREEGAAEKARILQQEFRNRLGAVLYTLHPADLPGEIIGKAANEAWAARWARRHFVDRLGYDIRYITVTSCDADSVFPPNYFACLTSKFATDPERYDRFWQAPLFYHNNVWQVPAFIRFITLFGSIWQLASLTDPRANPYPSSTYSTSLVLLDSVGYWDPDDITEDWHIFCKCFFRRHGRVRLVPIYLPISGDAPQSYTLLRTAINRYEQAKRHAWQISELPYIVKAYFQHPEIAAGHKLRHIWTLIREHLLWSTSCFVISLDFAVPALLNPTWVTSQLGLALHHIYTLIGGIATALSPVALAIDLLLRPPRPPERKWWHDVCSCLQWALLPLIILLFIGLPSLDAQTRLMGGEKLTYRVTEKV